MEEGRSEPGAMNARYPCPTVWETSGQCSEYRDYALKELGCEGKREAQGDRNERGGGALLFKTFYHILSHVQATGRH